MKEIEIVNIYRDCGFSIKKIGEYFFLKRGIIKYSFPTLTNIPLSNKLINSTKWSSILTLIKTESKIKNTSEYVIDVENYSLEKFSSKTRNQIRKSLKDCEFKRPSLDDMFNFALKINQQTLGRHGRSEKFLTDSQSWNKYISVFFNNESVIILGAYINNLMVGYVICYNVDDKFIILHPFIDKNFSSSAPMNGLLFNLVNMLLEKNKQVKVSYGIESFNPNPNLNKFKSSMLFQSIPSTRAYVINPFLIPFIKIVIFFYISVLKHKTVQKPRLRTLISLYQGNRLINRTLK